MKKQEEKKMKRTVIFSLILALALTLMPGRDRPRGAEVDGEIRP